MFLVDLREYGRDLGVRGASTLPRPALIRRHRQPLPTALPRFSDLCGVGAHRVPDDATYGRTSVPVQTSTPDTRGTTQPHHGRHTDHATTPANTTPATIATAGNTN